MDSVSMRTAWASWWQRAWVRQPLERAYSSSRNSFGFLRLLFAFAVLVSHTFKLGYGQDDPVGLWSHGQAEIGSLSVTGFFVISGFLITRSGRRTALGRFAWHRVLRILPAFWICLLVTAFVLAPIVALIERGSLSGFWGHPEGPLQYVWHNWFIAIRQYEISGLLLDVPYGRMTGSGAIDGSLWSLVYEMMCYVMVAALAVFGILRRARVAVLAAAAAGLLLAVVDLLRAGPGPHGLAGPVFGIDGLDWHDLIFLTYAFILGAVLDLYRDRIWLSDGLAIVAGLTVVLTLQFGAFGVLGFPAYAYLILWAATRLPGRLQRVGRRNDYSYGFYIYAFPVQQIFALVGVPSWGFIPYLVACTVVTLGLAAASWHVIERPALSFKDWTPPRLAGSTPQPSQQIGAP